MKRNECWLVVFVLIVVTGSPVYGAPSSWSHSVEFEVKKPGPQVVKVPLEVLDVAQPNRQDVRILSPTEQMIPYYMRTARPEDPAFVSMETYDLKRSDTETWIRGVTGVDGPIDGVRFGIDNDRYLKTVTVEGSRNMEEWTRIATDEPIFGGPGGTENRMIDLPEQRWKFLRFTIDDRRSRPVRINDISLRRPPSESGRTEVLAVSHGEESNTAERTIVDLEFPHGNLPVLDLKLNLKQEAFRRRVELRTTRTEKGVTDSENLAEGVVYRFELPGGETRERMWLPVNKQLETTGAQLHVHNRDHPPVNVTGVEAVVPELRMVFWAHRKGTYRLLAGNRSAEAPDYDVGWLKELAGRREAVRTLGGELRANARYQQPGELPQLPTRGAQLDSSEWSYRNPVEVNSKGIKWLELDPAILSRAKRDFRDLRLLTGNYQVPYVLDDRVIRRELKTAQFKHQGTSEGKTTWSIELPESRLPLMYLTATVKQSLFDRNVVLYEEATNHRGEHVSRRLGEARWRKPLGSDQQWFNLYLDRPPKSGELFLEIHNGNNAPLELTDQKIFYETHRIFFRADAPGSLALLYGNDEARNPRYDIALARSQILSSQADRVSIGGKDRTSSEPWWAVSADGQGATVVLWVVMIGVVVGLLFVIARLLPEVEEGESEDQS